MRLASFLRIGCAALVLGLAAAAPVAAAPLDSTVIRITSEGRAGQALWGVYAVDLKTGREVASVNADRLFLPASNRKLVTAALATQHFAADDRISTAVEAREVSGGTASGVVVRAAGDPSWCAVLQGGRPGRAVLSRLAKQIAGGGVRRIDGDIAIDVSRFDDPEPMPPAWSWDEFSASYASTPSALAVDMNLAGVKIQPGVRGEPPRVEFTHPVRPFEIRNTARTGAAGAAPTLVVDRDLSGSTVLLAGVLPADAQPATRSIPMGEPVMTTGQMFALALRDAGIEFTGDVVIAQERPAASVTLGTVEGAEISMILRECMEESNNFLAESLYLLAGGRKYGRMGYRASRSAEADYWKRLKVDVTDIESSDGSGLSRENLISPRAMVALLRDRASSDWFVAALPVSGRTGTLRYRLSENGLAGRVQAKTGTLDGVSALSGYVRTEGGRTIAFSVFANNYTCSAATIRASIDRIVAEIARQ
jgi:D-alanyl-D-alanine carboxypeptidase/D-alanyl-D-alanine-endopeptidase (penicillin-binding protein 4)